MFQQMGWWTLLMILLIIYGLLKFMKGYVERLGIFQPCTIPGIKGNDQLFFLYQFYTHSKNSTSSCPILCAGLQTLVGLCQLYGKNGLFRVSLLFKPVVLFFNAETVEVILSSAELIDKSKEYTLIEPWLGSGLITSESTKWRKHRKLLTPTFHFSILDNITPVFQEHAHVLISKIKDRLQEPWIEILPLLSMCTLDIICETAMGVSMNIQKGENSYYSNAVHEIEETFMHRLIRPWLHPNIIFNLTTLGKRFNENVHRIHEFDAKVIKQKIEKMAAEKLYSTADNVSNKCLTGEKIRKPFLELLLEYKLNDPSFTEKDIRDEVSTFMAAGHDTSAITLSFVLYCLGLYPEIQRKVHKELDAIFGNEKIGSISRTDLTKMKFLECVIKESFRVYPTVPFIARENNRPFKVLNHTVNRGTFCVIFVWALHRDPDIFPEPEKFNPERFLPENSKGRNPYAFIPFSAGPRNCMGQRFAMMEMKTVLACLLRHFRVHSLDARDKVLVYPNLNIRTAQPLRLKFEPR